MDNTPLVSVICLTYNHEKYIRQCLDGFLMQKTDFPYEVLINDDASTDGTVAILSEYKKKYPNNLTVLFHEKNQYSDSSLPHQQVMINMFNIAKGKYLAFCEGDDYWCDEHKLQNQVDFLESNQEYSALYHNVNIVNQNNEVVKHGSFFSDLECHECDISVLSEEGKIDGHVSSLVCRNFYKQFSEKVRKDFSEIRSNGDWLIYAINCSNGKVLYQDKRMSTYRHITNDGVSWSARTRSKNMCLFRFLAMYDIKAFLNESYSYDLECTRYLDGLLLESYIFMIKHPSIDNVRIYRKIKKMHGRTSVMRKSLVEKIKKNSSKADEYSICKVI